MSITFYVLVTMTQDFLLEQCKPEHSGAAFAEKRKLSTYNSIPSKIFFRNESKIHFRYTKLEIINH